MQTLEKSPFHIHDFLLARIAAAPYEQYILKSIQDWLNDPLFKSGLQLASESLYKELERSAFSVEQLSTATLRSIKKYANRMCGRAVPFGAFSGFLPSTFGGDKVIIENEFELHLQEDFSEILLNFKSQRQKNHDRYYQTNPTLYNVSGSTRYLATDIDHKGCVQFSLRSVQKERLITDVAARCSTPRPTSDILHHINRKLHDMEDAAAFLDELITEQILLPFSYPRITGAEMKVRIITRNDLSENEIETRTLLKSKKQWYANLLMKGNGGVPKTVKSTIQKALYAIRKLSPSNSRSDLDNFKAKFVERFGNRSVPLMEVLDIEIGIGYANLSKANKGMALLEEMGSSRSNQQTNETSWGNISRLMLQKWPKQVGGEIILDDEDLGRLPENSAALPPGLSVLFRYEDGVVWVDNCGGCSATALAGRFSPLDTTTANALSAVAAEEQSNAPDIIFAEVVSLSEGRTDNVNRRAVLRPYEIPLNTISNVREDHQIYPSSLMVSVSGNDVMLYCNHLDKRVLPRLSSAYNYKRSSLPLLRLLGDLQYQDIQQQWTADPAIFFPGLDYYPRVSYHHAVLSPATWIIAGNELTEAIKGDLGGFEAFATTRNLPRYISVGEHDRYLCLDLKNPDDIRLLDTEARVNDRVTIREIPAPKKRGGIVVNEKDQSHIAQFNALVTCDFPKNTITNNFSKIENRPTMVFPGISWLYYKLYLPANNSDALLCKLKKVIRSLSINGRITSWFFVRFLDPEPHLRLRLKINNGGLEATNTELSRLLQKEFYEGRIHRIAIEPYEPEISRYRAIGMDTAEQLFKASSELVTKALSHTEFQHHTFAIRTTYDSVKQLIPDARARLAILAEIREQLLREEPRVGEFKKGLERTKRSLRALTATVVQSGDFYQQINCQHLASRYLRFLDQLDHLHPDHPQIVADICHMHINRCFPAEMRRQELIVYTLLHQYELTMQKNKKLFL